MLQNVSIGWAKILLPKQAPSPGVFLYYGSSCPPSGVRNCGSPCQSLVKRKGTIYSKVIQV